MMGTLHAVLLKVDQKNGDRGWRDPRDAPCLPQRGRPDMRQFLADLMREARDLPVINLLGQRHSFELFEARHLLELTPNITLVLQVDFDLLNDRWWQSRLLTHEAYHISVRQLRPL